jgi:hypothetical protein
MGGASEAEAKVIELREFAKDTPFALPGVLEAQRLLYKFGGEALASKERLRLIGDASAVAGQSRSVIIRPMTMGANAKVCDTERSNSPLIMSRVTPRATMPSEAERAASALNWGNVRKFPPERA